MQIGLSYTQTIIIIIIPDIDVHTGNVWLLKNVMPNTKVYMKKINYSHIGSNTHVYVKVNYSLGALH